jgi:transcriptional regulator with XRE-family HTH domain
MLNDRIKMTRETAKITQAELAEKINRSRVTVGHWESGEREPSASELQKLAAFLNTSAAYLIGEIDEPGPSMDSPIVNIAIAEDNSSINSSNNAIGVATGNTVTVTPVRQNHGVNEASIVFERGEGAAKIRMVLPPTPETYAFLERQVPPEK